MNENDVYCISCMYYMFSGNRFNRKFDRCKHIDFTIKNKIWNDCIGYDLYANVPIIDVNSIWEFYQLVGYDYKKRKWNERDS